MILHLLVELFGDGALLGDEKLFGRIVCKRSGGKRIFDLLGQRDKFGREGERHLNVLEFARRLDGVALAEGVTRNAQRIPLLGVVSHRNHVHVPIDGLGRFAVRIEFDGFHDGAAAGIPIGHDIFARDVGGKGRSGDLEREFPL